MQHLIINSLIVTPLFQSMHPIKDATVVKCPLLIQYRISIHAPYKGCNLAYDETGVDKIISIHAPYKGCNKTPSFLKRSSFYFNPCTL